MNQRMRRTKIVATLGPSTDKDDILKKIIQYGVNVLRLNFSHGMVKDHFKRVKKIQEIRKNTGCHVALLGDLQGPKIRISKFQNSKIYLKVNNIFILDVNYKNKLGNEKIVGVDYEKLPLDLIIGDNLLLDDGKIQLEVIKIDSLKIFTKVILGGFLSNNKGINKIGGGLSANSITEKDKQDIVTAAKMNIDYLAISFPRSSKDLALARKLLIQEGSQAKIIAKIERAEVVSNDAIMKEMILSSDGIMVARGDLGVEIGYPELVGIQKKLIRMARKLNKFVITATQMMETMIDNPYPTRAEVMDVANAVLDGTDAVMLSSETATGKFPIETIQCMDKVCKGAEKMPSINVSRHRIDLQFRTIEEAISMSAMYSANHLKGVVAIITMTESGKTALLTSRITSGLPIFALSKNIKTLYFSSLYRGVTPVYFDTKKKGLKATQEAITKLVEKKFLFIGNLVIVTQGDIMGSKGKTNSSRILQVQ
ncbi:pyruvate kinase [Buchnera aphidicola (Kurisakia onigurumii)]|uniref:pyruvate kinase n=1 Tax=Buchnera aphidicola TaxID=9 RepID=UPI0031B6C9D4